VDTPYDSVITHFLQPRKLGLSFLQPDADHSDTYKDRQPGCWSFMLQSTAKCILRPISCAWMTVSKCNSYFLNVTYFTLFSVSECTRQKHLNGGSESLYNSFHFRVQKQKEKETSIERRKIENYVIRNTEGKYDVDLKIKKIIMLWTQHLKREQRWSDMFDAEKLETDSGQIKICRPTLH
jgi:hypothetical protein